MFTLYWRLLSDRWARFGRRVICVIEVGHFPRRDQFTCTIDDEQG